MWLYKYFSSWRGNHRNNKPTRKSLDSVTSWLGGAKITWLHWGEKTTVSGSVSMKMSWDCGCRHMPTLYTNMRYGQFTQGKCEHISICCVWTCAAVGCSFNGTSSLQSCTVCPSHSLFREGCTTAHWIVKIEYLVWRFFKRPLVAILGWNLNHNQHKYDSWTSYCSSTIGSIFFCSCSDLLSEADSRCSSCLKWKIIRTCLHESPLVQSQ